MFPEDIEFLFDYIALNTSVRIVNEPIKIGWQDNALVLEAHPVLESAPVVTTDEPHPEMPATEAVASDDAPAGEVLAEQANAADAEVDVPEVDVIEKDPLTYVTEQFIVATAERAGELDWDLVEAAVARSDGLPVVVGAGIKNAATSAASE
jgi:L,D-transpeptidase ErfK/SrfK